MILSNSFVRAPTYVKLKWRRSVEVTLARLRSGHAFTNNYKHEQIDRRANPYCRKCEQEKETIEHILIHCNQVPRPSTLTKELDKINKKKWNQMKITDLIGNKILRQIQLPKWRQGKEELEKYLAKLKTMFHI